MTSKKSTENKEFPVSTSGLQSWWTYPIMIKWKITKRNELDKIKKGTIIDGINSSIIVDCTCLIEGILDYIMRERIDGYEFKDGDYNFRINENILDRLDNSQFNQYVSIYQLIFGQEIKNVVGNDIWKGIKSLFSFRNLIVHGNRILLDFYTSKDKFKVEAWGKYKPIYDYLIEKKITNRYVENTSVEIEIFESKVADHYFNLTMQFVELLALEIKSEHLEDIKYRILDSLKYEKEL